MEQKLINKTNNAKIFFLFTLLVSIFLFALSLNYKAFCVPHKCFESLNIVLSGWIGLMVLIPGLFWLANPLLWFSWILFFNRKISLRLNTSAFIISLCFLALPKIMIDEGGSLREITSYKEGYWLWLGSSFILVCGNIYRTLAHYNFDYKKFRF